MAAAPLVRLCAEEVSKPLPLPSWATARDRAAGRIVATPPSTPAQPPLTVRVEPPWALWGDGSRPATGRRGGRRTEGLRLEETAQGAAKAAEMAEAVSRLKNLKDLTSNPHLVIPPGPVKRPSSRATSSRRAADAEEAPPWQLQGGQSSCLQAKETQLSAASKAVADAGEATQRAKAALLETAATTAEKVAMTGGQRKLGIKAGSEGLMRPRSAKRRLGAQLRREHLARREVEAALDAQVARAVHERACEKEEDKYFAAQAIAGAVRDELAEVAAQQAWKAKCKAVQQEVMAQRQERRQAQLAADAWDGSATGLNVGKDALGELREQQQRLRSSAAMRAEDLSERQQRKAEEAARRASEEAQAAQQMLRLNEVCRADRRARRHQSLVKQCAKVLRGEQMALKGGGIPTGRWKPRSRPNSAELEKQAAHVRKALARKELMRMRREAAERQRQVREMFADAAQQIRLHESQKEAELAEERRVREEVEYQAVSFRAETLQAAASKRQKEAEHAAIVRQQAEEDRSRKQREREARLTN